VKVILLIISGDINTWEKQLNGEQWKIGVENPLNVKQSFLQHSPRR
jgi:thiamine biosynthesis lipoprotein ApbE